MLSKLTTLVALIALCIAGSAAAHEESAIVNDASVGNNSAPTGTCVGNNCGNIGADWHYEDWHYEEIRNSKGTITIGSNANYVHDGSPVGNFNTVAVAAYQKQLAHQAAIATTLIEDNAEILSPSCLVQVETLQRSLRNAYSSTGGKLPLYGTPFNRDSPEFRGYVAALVDQSRKTSAQIESMVTYNCRDPNATSFYRGEVVGPSYTTEIGNRAN